jgi:hypothetical protein
MSGPRITSGSESRQDYATPPDFMAAVERRFGRIVFDLAAHAENKKHPDYFGPGGQVEDSLSAAWLNPPFSHISPWAEKCALESSQGAEILMLITASVGTNYFRDFIAPFAEVFLLSGRICFDGENLFPKDCLLAWYRYRQPKIHIWDWKNDEIFHSWQKVQL